jgi:hypothetical protein
VKFTERVEGTAPISARCPVCGVIVPMITVEVQRYGFLRRRIGVVVDGDATDFVAHLWSHSHPVWHKSDI